MEWNITIALYQVSEAEMETGSAPTLTVETQTLPGGSSAIDAALTNPKVLAVVVEMVIFPNFLKVDNLVKFEYL